MSYTANANGGSVVIRRLNADDQLPMELLLLADPSVEIILTYIKRGYCYTAVIDGDSSNSNNGISGISGESSGTKDDDQGGGQETLIDAKEPSNSVKSESSAQLLVGVYVLIDTRPETVELVNVAVDEAFQGKGIGKQLVLHAVETARQMGYKTIELGTGNSGMGQLELYQKCGFRIVGVDLDFFTRHYPEPIYENGILCRDMIRLVQHIDNPNHA